MSIKKHKRARQSLRDYKTLIEAELYAGMKVPLVKRVLYCVGIKGPYKRYIKAYKLISTGIVDSTIKIASHVIAHKKS